MEPAALEDLYEARLPVFRRVAAGITGNRESARDAVQEAFVTAVRKRRSFRGDGPLEAWVWRIVVNTARNHRRREGARLSAEADGAAPLAAGELSARELPLHVLTDRQREIIFLHYFADLGYEEIAAALAISPGTVGATLTTARAALRRAMTEVTA
jgi:RNA polymerase sigma-70 factor (ECF subfamily)